MATPRGNNLKAIILALIKDGTSQADIAKLLKCSRGTVAYHVKKPNTRNYINKNQNSYKNKNS